MEQTGSSFEAVLTEMADFGQTQGKRYELGAVLKLPPPTGRPLTIRPPAGCVKNSDPSNYLGTKFLPPLQGSNIVARHPVISRRPVTGYVPLIPPGWDRRNYVNRTSFNPPS